MKEHPRLMVIVAGRGFVEPGQAAVFADDLGYTRGDGCFDATLVRTDDTGGSRVGFLGAHLERMTESARIMGIPTPAQRHWEDLVDQLLRRWSRPGEAVLKLILTRGREYAGGDVGEPRSLAILAALDAGTIAARGPADVVTLTRGHPLGIHDDAPWLLGGAKHLSYGVNMAARREAVSRGADDALFVTTEGDALEGPTAALIWSAGGALYSTLHRRTGILPSTTQRRIFDAAGHEGLPCRYELIQAADLTGTDGAWLASAVRGLSPIRRLDGVPMTMDEALTARMTAWVDF